MPRLETLGVYHDVFIRGPKGHIYCECDGRNDISKEKLLLFRDEVLKLNSLLIEGDQPPVSEARLVVMLPIKEWDTDVSDLLEIIRDELSSVSIRLTLVEPKRLLYDLVATSVLGFVLLDNHVILVGPGHWAIRYNASVSKFMYGESSVDPDKFRKLPQSFMARDYWNERHKEVYEEYAKMTQESLPQWFSWKFPDNFGIRWKNTEQMARAILKAYSKNGRIIVHKDPRGFVALRKLKKGSYYSANLVYSSDIIGPDDAPKIDDELSRLVEDFSRSGEAEEGIDFYYRIFTDTITFSHMYWTRAKFRKQNGGASYTEIHRGDDVLVETLNSGDLGIRLDGNRICFTLEEGPDSMTLVRGSLQWESSEEGTYPATLKF